MLRSSVTRQEFSGTPDSVRQRSLIAHREMHMRAPTSSPVVGPEFARSTETVAVPLADIFGHLRVPVWDAFRTRLPLFIRLEKHFQCQLNNPRIISGANAAKVTAAFGHGVRAGGVVKLCVVKNVEEFSPQLNAKVFMGAHGIEGFMKPHIHVPIRGAAEGSFSDISERSYGGLGKQRSVEPRHADIPWRARTSGSTTRRRHAAVLAWGSDELCPIPTQIGF